MEKQLKDYKKEEFADNKEEINALIGEIACDMAFEQLKQANPGKEVIEIDPYGDGVSTRYKEEFQDEFNRYYDEEEGRLATEIGFDFFAEDGILIEE